VINEARHIPVFFSEGVGLVKAGVQISLFLLDVL
jgi:hypothetical protein